MRKMSHSKLLSFYCSKLSLPIILVATIAAIGSAIGREAKAWAKQDAKLEAKQHAEPVAGNKQTAKQFVIRKELAVNPGGTLTLDADFGAVEIQQGPANRVSVEVIRSITEKYADDAEAILGYHQVSISKAGNNAVVKSRLQPPTADSVSVDGLGFDISEDVRRTIKTALKKRLKRIHFRVTVPREYNVNLKTGGQHITCGDVGGKVHCTTSGGGITLGQITGSVHAKTSGGSLRLAGAGGAVQLKTSGGSIRAGDIGGDAVAATSGGSISLGRIRGRASAKTSGGSIHILDAAGAVEAVTCGGSVHVAISQQPKADSYFATSGGTVNVALAKGLALDVEHQGQGKANGPFFRNSQTQGRVTKLNGGGPKLMTKGNVRFAYLNAK